MVRAGLRRLLTPLRVVWRRSLVLSPLPQGPAGRPHRLPSLGRAAAPAGGSRQPAARALPLSRPERRCARWRVGVRPARRRRQAWHEALHGFRVAAGAVDGRRRRRAQAGHQSDRRNGSSATPVIPNRSGCRRSWRGGWRHLQPWPAGDRQFRTDVALQAVRLACASSRACWSASRTKRPTACRGWKRRRCWRCRASAWTTAQAAGSRPEAAGRRSRAPDPARWRPCQPLARSAAVEPIAMSSWCWKR